MKKIYQPLIDQYIKNNFNLLDYKWYNSDEDYSELVYGKEFMDNLEKMIQGLDL